MIIQKKLQRSNYEKVKVVEVLKKIESYIEYLVQTINEDDKREERLIIETRNGIKSAATIVEEGAPTEMTAAAIGQLYLDTLTKDIYMKIEDNGGLSLWKRL